MNEQATALQDYIRRKNLRRVVGDRKQTSEASGKVTAVTSGKGGVGKTTIALNMALSSDKKTLVVDGDLHMGDLATFTNESAKISWRQVLRRPDKWQDGLIQLSETTEVFAPSSLKNPENSTGSIPETIVHLLGHWRKLYDYVIIDTATGLGAQVIEWCLAADQVILVVTPDPAACTDGYALLKALHVTGEVSDMGVLVNQYLEKEDPNKIFEQLQLLSGQFLNRTISNYGAIPWSTEIIAASRDQRPVVHHSQTSFLRKEFGHPLANPGDKNQPTDEYLTVTG